MIICPNCGMQLDPGTRFCINCGAAINEGGSMPENTVQNENRCSNCGNIINPGELFCTACGTIVNQGEQTPAQAPREPQQMQNEMVQEAEPCNNCGYFMPQGSMFCERCGAPMNATVAAYPTVPPAAPKKEKKSSKLPLILTLCISGVIILILAAVIVLLVFFPDVLGLGKTSGSEVKEAVDDVESMRDFLETRDYYFDETFEIAEPDIETEEVTEEITEEDTTMEEPEEEDPLVYFIENADSRYFSLSEIEEFTAGECRLARNGIYARHGRMFNDSGLQQYFLRFDWYHPTVAPEKFSESVLNRYEIANRDLIVQYEKAKGYN